MPLAERGFAVNDLMSVVGYGRNDVGYTNNQIHEKFYGTNRVTRLFKTHQEYENIVAENDTFDQVEIRGAAWWAPGATTPTPLPFATS